MKRNKRENTKNKYFTSFIFLFAFLSVLFLTVGYSSMSTNMALNGKAMVRPNLDLRVTSVKLHGSTNGGLMNSNPKYTEYTITTDSSFPNSSSTVTYDVTVTNLSSNKAFLTNVDANIFNNDNIEYYLTNMELNETIISAASTYTFQITFKVKDGVSLTSDQLVSQLKFTFYKKPLYSYTVNSVPNNATIVLKVNGEVTATSTGTATVVVEDGDTVSYDVSAFLHYPKTGEEVVNADTIRTVELTYRPMHYLTVSPTPSDSVVTITQGGTILATGTGAQTLLLDDNTSVSYTATHFEYYDSTGTFDLGSDDKTCNVVLTEMPWITGTTANTDGSVAATSSGVNYHPGYYLIEVWGGQGGTGNKTTGASGYVYGVVYIPYNYYVIGSAGGNGSSSTSEPSGGANGGGIGGKSGTGTGGNKGAGGGYSSVIVSSSNNATISSDTISSGVVKFIAAGGGGASSKSGTFGTGDGGNGGDGGNMTSIVSSITAGSVFSGKNGTGGGNNTSTPGKGGSTTAGAKGSSASDGDFLNGGNGYERGGGGGAGYYGGGGGGISNIFAANAGGGGGGSSFIAKDVTYSGLSNSITSKLVGSNPSSTGGAIIITYIGKTL